MSFYYKAKKIQEPNIQTHSAKNLYGSSLSALDNAWASVAAAKKELTNVDSKIRQSVVSPIYERKKNVDFNNANFPPPPLLKSKNNPNIEKRLVYQYADDNKFRKENIPPPSYPTPAFFSFENTDLPHFNTNTIDDFMPTQKELRDTQHRTVREYQPDFNYSPETKHLSDKHPVNSSLLRRSLLKTEQRSNALSRLKEKISQQKINSTLTSENSNESHFPEKLAHKETDLVKRIDDSDGRNEIKRKIAPAPSAPSYKGFNPAEKTYTKPISSHDARKQRQLEDAPITTQKFKKKPIKTKQSKVKNKTQRIVAPKKPPTNISTSSWRVGQEIQRKIKRDLKSGRKPAKRTEDLPEKYRSTIPEEVKNEKSEPVSSVKESVKSDGLMSEVSESHKLHLHDNVQTGKLEKAEMLASEDELEEQFIEDSIASIHEEDKKEDYYSRNEDEEERSENSLNELQKKRNLTKTAKDVLKEISAPSKEIESPPRKVISAVVDTGLKKSKKAKLNQVSPSVKRKSEEEINPQRKIRHYDQEEVQRYMMKQQAERKKQRLGEKKKEMKTKELQEQKLKELYDKQKAAVKESLELKKRHTYGDTFIKKKPYKPLQQLKEALSEVARNNEPVKAPPSNPKLTSSLQQVICNDDDDDDDDDGDDIFRDSLDEQGFSTIGDVQITARAGLLKKDYMAKKSQANPFSPSLQSLNEDISAHNQENPVVGLPLKEDVAAPIGYNKSKADRVAAIRATAAALRQRLDMEAKRISSLVQGSNLSNTSFDSNNRWAQPIAMECTHDVEHGGVLPGTDNIDSQAALNEKLKRMDEAAKKIQSLYRGHQVRKTKSWLNPTGQTLYQTLEEARRRAFLADLPQDSPIRLASDNYPSVLPKRKQADEEISDDVSSISSSVSKKNGSTLSLIGEALKSSKALLSDAERSVSSISSKKKHLSSGTLTEEINKHDSFPSYSSKDNEIASNINALKQNERLREVLKKHKDVKGDKYSVINVFARNYPSLHRQQLSDAVASTGTETEKLLADAYEHEVRTSAEQSSINEYLTEESYMDLPKSSASLPATTAWTSALPSELAVTKPAAQRTLLSPKTVNSDSDASERLFSPCSPRQESRTPEANVMKDQPLRTPTYSFTEESDLSPEHSHTLVSSHHQSGIFSDFDQQDLNPVLTSTKRSPGLHEKEKQETSETPLTHFEQPSNTKQPKRLSPNTLERRLRAEINMFDAVGDSLQQVNEMDKVRNIVHAQQETVSLAQILKSRHLQHQQDLEKLSLDAKERAMISAKDVEAARLATAEATANAMKAIAEIKSKASEDVLASAKNLAEVQDRATSTTVEAMNRVEKARQAAADAYKSSVERQVTDVEKLATAAASAASSTAVEVALQHHRKQLEELRKQALAKVSNAYSSSSDTHSTLSKTNTSDPSVNSSHSISTGGQAKLRSSSASSKPNDSVASSYSEHFEKDEGKTKTESSLSEEIESVAESKTDTPSSEHTPKIVSEPSRKNVQLPGSSTPVSEAAKTSGIVRITPGGKEINESISEDLPSVHEDRELSEALFTSDKKNSRASSVSIAEEESVHSVHSEDKFHSSFTEEELKHDFRMVLPSENHRRQSLDHKDYILSGNDTSSDELLTPRNVGKWTKKRSKSPFADENTFAKFTAGMVRQYVQEEEVRAKHQAALLALREKAIIEKTKAEISYLEMQKKSYKTAGSSDEKMPPIAKKQRALLLKLQAEQNEIRRLKEAHKMASYERKAMLSQEKEIQRIRESTQQLWNQMQTMDKSQDKAKDNVVGVIPSASLSPHHPPQESDASIVEEKDSVVSHVASSDEVPEDLAAEDVGSSTSQVSESISQSSGTQTRLIKSPNDIKTKGGATETDYTAPKSEKSSMSQDLRKLKYMASKKYLTDREKKLQVRKQQFNEIIERKSKLKNWRQKIQDEEQRLKADIRRVLEKRETHPPDTSEHEEFDADKTLTESVLKPSPQTKTKTTTALGTNSETDTSISEDVSSMAEDVSPEKSSKRSSVAEAIQSSKSSTSVNAVSSSRATTVPSPPVDVAQSPDTSRKKDSSTAYTYSNEDFEEISSTKSESKKEKSKEKAGRRKEMMKIDEDSFIECTSDASDIEQRLKGLENELQRRKTELQRLRKKKEKENLRRKEQELRKELQAVEQQIHCENKENIAPDVASRIQQPRVLSPRSSLDSIILPEKIKFSSEKESRRSLDFSDKDLRSRGKEASEKENEEEKPMLDSKPVAKGESFKATSKISQKDVSSSQVDVCAKRSKVDESKSASKTSLNSVTDVVADERIEELSSSSPSSSGHSTSSKDKHLQKSTSILDQVGDVAVERSGSSISEHVATEKGDTQKTSIAEELSSTSNTSVTSEVSEVSDQYADEHVYDDDFFEIPSSKPSFASDVKESDAVAEDDYEDDFDDFSKPSSKVDISKDSHKETSTQSSSASISKEKVNKKTLDMTSQSGQQEADQATSDHSNKTDISDKSYGSVNSKSNIFEELKRLTDAAIGTSLSSSSDEYKLSQSCQSTRELSESISEHLPSLSDRNVKSEVKETISSTSSKITSASIKSASVSAKTSSSSAVIQPDAFSKSNASSAFGFHVHDRVLVEDTMVGTIRFLGKTAFSPVLVAGIELDKAMGTNDGSFQGKQYFTCSNDFGLFTTIERIKLLPADTSTKKDPDESDSSTIQDVQEVLSNVSDEPMYDDNFEKSVDSPKVITEESNQRDDESKHEVSLPASSSAHAVESSSSKNEDFKPGHARVSKSSSESEHSFLKEDEFDLRHKMSLDFDVKSHSSSDVESIEVEIPSPAKLDLTPLAYSITDDIMKSLIVESLLITEKQGMNSSVKDKKQTPITDEKSEAYIIPKALDVIAKPEVVQKQSTIDSSLDSTTHQLLRDAVSHMIQVKEEKDSKLLDQEVNDDDNKSNDTLLTLLTNEGTMLDALKKVSKSDQDVSDSDKIAEKLNQLKNVHDQLGELLGDDEDDEDEDVGGDTPMEGDLLLPPQGFGLEEVSLQIPYNKDSTSNYVHIAFDNVLRRDSSIDIVDIFPDDLDELNDENLDEESTKLYKHLLYDVTRSLLYDIRDFRDLQTSPRPQWMKIPRKTFSKFTRKAHALREGELRETMTQYVCACLDITSGRPSLEKLKKKLPLNLTKKDYVDAVLVEELREEEAQWVNYDKDELRVKFQLADAILDNLINETIELLSRM